MEKVLGLTLPELRNRMKIKKVDHWDPTVDRDLYSGMMRLYVLHHATEGPIFGLGMVEELARHGYRISPGTLYPEHRDGKSLRKVYRATPLGRKALTAAKAKVREFIGELMEGR
jgi:DNA-binding PadR family transcriptional regulator